ncbi:hypothetical protein TorRG33x02_326430, partial [Trema orientale]
MNSAYRPILALCYSRLGQTVYGRLNLIDISSGLIKVNDDALIQVDKAGATSRAYPSGPLVWVDTACIICRSKYPTWALVRVNKGTRIQIDKTNRQGHCDSRQQIGYHQQSMPYKGS